MNNLIKYQTSIAKISKINSNIIPSEQSTINNINFIAPQNQNNLINAHLLMILLTIKRKDNIIHNIH